LKYSNDSSFGYELFFKKIIGVSILKKVSDVLKKLFKGVNL